MRLFVTGDKHGDFSSVDLFCEKIGTTVDDVMIILGDAGINYTLTNFDKVIKESLSELPITLFCVHGNHEARPQTISTYKTKWWNGGRVFYEEAYPNILFAEDGELYTLNDKKYIVIGGAYSVDKPWRLARGARWFADEQPSDEIKRDVDLTLTLVGWKVDAVLSHTCPLRYEPTEVFLRGIDQSDVDKSTEIWLNTIEYDLRAHGGYDDWYCGHYHTEKDIDKMHFMFHDIEEIL